MRRHLARIAVTAMLLTASAWVALAQNSASSGSSPAVATVGRMSISSAEFKERFDLARSSYRERAGEPIPAALEPTFRRTVLEQMIRAQLLMLVAERDGMLVSEAEATEHLKKSPFFNQGGRFNAARFEATRVTNPAAFATALSETRLRISGARMEERITRKHQPDEAKLRAAIERELTSASIDVLVLPFDSFDGRGDEPAEQEILDYYAAHASEFDAPLEDVAADIRAKLRAERRSGSGEEPLRAMYENMRGELRSPAAKVRYAFFDPATIEVKSPSASDLDRYYRGHIADYSSFDAARGEIRQKPFDEVRDQVRSRWFDERRVIEARAAGERLVGRWERGRRDRRLERQATVLEESPLVPLGQPVDAGRFGRVLGDTLAARRGSEGAGMFEAESGILVFQIFDAGEDMVPPFEAVRGLIERHHAEALAEEERAAAKLMFDADPSRFARDSTVHFSRVVIPLPKPIDVPLTRQEVERHHRENIDKYSAIEVVAARHILVSPAGPDPANDQAARLKAEGLLRRVRAGEDFNELASEHSDDIATRDGGGDLGTFGRGLMHPVFERVVFQMRAGDVSDLVRTPQGYHIIKCTAYEPVKSLPLVEVYTNVGFDAAMLKSISLARQRADSVMKVVRSFEDARELAQRAGFNVFRNRKAVGEKAGTVELNAYYARLDEMKPGERYPLPVEVRGQGFAITWVDSISAPRPAHFPDVELEVISEYRRLAGSRALESKRAELDRMERNGWSLDSLATLFGGLVRLDEVQAGSGLPEVRGADQIDSLLFGRAGRGALRDGETSGWVSLPGGLARVRLVGSNLPDPATLAGRLERDRRKELERSLYFYFESLKRDFPVRIQDTEMASITLPPPTGADSR